ncbi:mechanosensitive ion channel family protein [Streptomyces microflavus]|jgi:small-conductance mechanosensitive channel|uniref:Mechanosensitive ion channel protein n=1 Tax=Streptomyces microflavus TaxID=1919 RepID=A0A7J0CL84_STRMI|nr:MULTISPECIES: mechanosensitive ion channel domain-containing protein [Streptomyces]MCX4651785.1 mechanosensitive ion channel family protein [Streptomyces microflavus]MDX2976481.1 mechanosensitive ion channel [Streptomyces sp. NRRL_B-2249]WSA60156.1 mechanosensitive ion channel family protein [Streptomyces microflavus]GFN03251.1 mechanosensitive ion channel protein [Streptomyces microflavus]GGX48156.1 mechanosensitive ion channel protein [Streptomyces microflavus]
MENVLRPLIVIGGSVVITLLVGWLVDRLLRRADSRHHETPLWGLLRRCRPPLQVVIITALLRGSYRQSGIAWVWEHRVGIGQLLSLVLIGASAWLVVRVAATVVESSYARYATSTRDPARVRRVRTQVTLIQRVVIAVVTVVAIAAMLLTFPAMRGVGTSMLASAGVLGIVAGVAAQSTLGNLFAGLQIAFGDMVRIGDTVVVDGEWGTVEEITLTFLAVRTWDERRITMPVSYFTSKPFENWSRGGVQMTGTVFFHLDHAAPVAAMRKKLRDILGDIAAWDGRDWSLAVTDTTPTTIQVRAVVTAKDADDIWTVRCAVREQLIGWLRDHHPYALPRVATSPATLPPGEQWADLTGAKTRPGRNGTGPSHGLDGSKAPRTGRG